MSLKYKGIEYKHGDNIIAKIGNRIILGKLAIQLGDYYICHNDSDFPGSMPRDPMGFNYGWCFRFNGADTFTDDIELLGIDKNPSNYRTIKVSDKLETFLSSQNIITSYLYKDTIFGDYDEFDVSDANGMIKLTGDAKKFGIIKGRKTMEIKLGRFVTSYVKSVKETIDGAMNFGIQDIEKIHNNYLTYQKGDVVEIKILEGDELLEGYKRSNYLKNKSSLGGSCMSDKLTFLKLYTQNPDKVKMVVVTMFDKILGRALLWTTNSGKQVIDKSYICDEWVYNKLEDYIRDNNLSVYHCTGREEIDVNVDGIEQWPYLDTFLYLTIGDDEKSGVLKNYSTPGYNSLRNTDGRIN